MPVIPTFTAQGTEALGGAGPPRADPGAFMAPGEALARGGQQLSDVGQAFLQRYADAQRQVAASQNVAAGMKAADDLQFELGKLPDRAAAMQQFGERFGQARQSILDGITDPFVKAHVASTLQTYGITRQELTGQAAFGVEAGKHNADQDARFGQFAGQLAQESNPLARAQIMDAIDADQSGAAASGWRHPEEAFKIASAAYRAAIQQRMENDPVGGQALLAEINQGKQRMTAEDVAHLDSQLKYAVPRRQAEDGAFTDYNRLRGNRGTAAFQPVADTTLPTEAQAFLPVLAGGEQTAAGYNSPPPAGDRSTTPFPSRYQFLSSTWNEQAPAAGVDVNDRSPQAQDRVAWNYARNTYATNTGGRDLQADLAQGGHEQQIAASLNKVWPSLPGGSQQNTDPATWQARMDRAFGKDSVQAMNRQFVADHPTMEPRFLIYHASTLQRLINEDEGGQSQARSDLVRDMGNLEASYQQGITSAEIPADRIRQLLPGERGDQLVRDLTLTRTAGDLYAGVQFATPDQEQAARAALATPGALASNLVKVVGHQAVPPAGGQITAADETPDAVRLRTHLLARYDELLGKKHKALMDDPLGFAASEPGVAAKIQAIDPRTGAGQTDAINTALDFQSRMGIPDRDARVLTNAQVAADVKQMTTGNPAQTDIGQVIDGMEARYGDLWPRAMGELIHIGKLPAAFQIVASMKEPGQIGARQDLIRALQQDTERGGAKRLAEIVPPTERKTIDQDIHDKLKPFVLSASVPGATGNTDLISAVFESVRSLAYFRATQGMDGDKALKSAVDGILNQKYDISGTLRAPKGQMAAAEAMTGGIQRALTPDMLAPIGGNPNLTADQRANVVATAARQDGVWTANERDDGAVLLAPLRDGSHVPVILKDGSRVEVKWRDLGKSPATFDDPAMGPLDRGPGGTLTLPHLPDLTGPDLSHLTNRPVGAALGDWFRQPPPLR